MISTPHHHQCSHLSSPRFLIFNSSISHKLICVDQFSHCITCFCVFLSLTAQREYSFLFLLTWLYSTSIHVMKTYMFFFCLELQNNPFCLYDPQFLNLFVFSWAFGLFPYFGYLLSAAVNRSMHKTLQIKLLKINLFF